MTLRVAAGVWALLVLGVAARVAVAPPRSHTVTPIYLAAAERFAHGQSLYVPVAGLDVYLYPPGFAAAVVPFTWVPERLGGILWRLLGAGLFFGGVWRIGRDVLRLDDRGLAWMLLLPIPLAIASLDNGQANLHMAGLVALGVAAVGRERMTAAAGCFALAVGIKVYPFAAGILFGVNRPRWVPTLVATSTAVILFPFICGNATYVWNQFLAMGSIADEDDRHHSASPTRVPRDWTVLTRTALGWVPAERTGRVVAAAAGIAFAGVVFASRRKTSDQQVLLTYTLGAVWMTLFGPATEPQTYTLLAPALAAILLAARGRPKGLAVVAWWLFTIPVIRDSFPNGWKLGLYGPHPAGAIALLLAAVWDTLLTDGNEAGGRVDRLVSRVLPTSTRWAART